MDREEYRDVLPVLENIIKQCEDYQKNEPEAAARIIAVANNFVIFTKKIEDFNNIRYGRVSEKTMSIPHALSSIRSIERSVEGICKSNGSGKQLCDYASNAFKREMEDMGVFFCNCSASNLREIKRNSDLANIFLKYADKRCSRLDEIKNLEDKKNEINTLRTRALSSRLNLISARYRYEHLLESYRSLLKAYYVLGAVDDIDAVKQEYISLKRRYHDLLSLWHGFVTIATALFSGAFLLLILIYIRYRMKIRRVAVL